MSDIQTVIDEAMIRKVHLRYCRGVDRMDWDLVRSCYHPDATDEHGGYSGAIDGYIDWLSASMPQYESTAHFTGNQLVEVSGESAWAEHYALVVLRCAATEEKAATDLIVHVRYVDRMERRSGEWRIARRVVIADSEKMETIEGSWLNLALLRPSCRDRSDYSYVR